MAADNVLAGVDDDLIIERIAAGEYQSHIADQLGVSRQALHQRLRNHPAYRLALETRNLGRLDQMQDALEAAKSVLDLARARESFRAAGWRAERECPAVWGAHTTVSGDPQAPLIALDSHTLLVEAARAIAFVLQSESERVIHNGAAQQVRSSTAITDDDAEKLPRISTG